MTEAVLRWRRLPPYDVKSFLGFMEQKNAQPFPSSCHQVILAPSTRRWWRFGPSSCLEILHSPQSQSSAWNIQYGQEVAVGEEVLSYWVCIVKSTSGESYVGNQLCWQNLHW